MRAAFVLLVGVGVLTFVASSDAEDYGDRSTLCLRDIRKLDGDAVPKAAWSGDCGWDQVFAQERAEYEADGSSPSTIAPQSGSLKPILMKGEACNDWRKLLDLNKGKCGRNFGNLLTNLGAAEIIVPLPGGYCVRYLPLLLTDKTGRFACNALRARVACATVSTGQHLTTVKLSTVPTAGGTEEVIAFSKDLVDRWATLQTLRKRKEHFALGVGRAGNGEPLTGQLFLLRANAPVTFSGAVNPSDGATVATRVALEAAVQERKCMDRHGNRTSRAAQCQVERVFHAERLVQEALRVDQNLRFAMLDQKRGEGLTRLLVTMASRKGQLSADEWVFYNAITYAEIGRLPDAFSGNLMSAYASPYQILDAVFDNSGVSWGAKQVDFFGNSGNDVKLFWESVDGPPKSPRVEDFAQIKSCYRLPLKSAPVAAWRVLLRGKDDINAALHRDTIYAIHDDAFTEYLRTSVKAANDVAASEKFFKQSLTARIYYLDQVNQRGSGARLIKVARTIDPPASSSEAAQCASERELFKAYDEQLQYEGKRIYPERWQKLACVMNKMKKRTTATCKAMEDPGCR